MMELQSEGLIRQIASLVELCSASILLYGFGRVLFKFWSLQIRGIIKWTLNLKELESLKPELGTYILLGLDFYIISDILSSMVASETQSLLSLAAVVVLRTLIGYFLGKELESFNSRREGGVNT